MIQAWSFLGTLTNKKEEKLKNIAFTHNTSYHYVSLFTLLGTLLVMH